MDINDLLDFTEELLNMYGYETRRNVGIVGGEVITTELSKELGTLDEKERLPKVTEKGIVYKADILAEKKDIERPFGKIVVRYKRGHDPINPNDVKHIQALIDASDAYSGLLLTVTGNTAKAQELVEKAFGHITIMTPEKVQRLMGKSMTKDKWWFNAPAYPIEFHMEAVQWKIKWHLEKMMRINFDCISFFNKELSYEPYWKISYYIAPKKKGGKIKTDYFGLNAYTGALDIWTDIRPEIDTTKSLKTAYIGWEAVKTVEFVHMVPRTKIQKPKLPKGWKYVVYKPAMEKHEAKLAAIQWIAYCEGVDPKDVVVTGRELIYYPWWKIHYYYTPIIQNAWNDVEWDSFKLSGVYGDVFNAYKHFEKHRRDIIYYHMEKSLLRLFGRDRYVRFMNKVTAGINMLWWNYHLVLKPSYMWLIMILLTALVGYVFFTASWGISTIISFLITMIILGPLFAFLYIVKDFLTRYPSPEHAHPAITKKEWESKEKPYIEAEGAFEELERLEAEGKLTEKEKKKLKKIRKRLVKKRLKKVKKGKEWWKTFKYLGERRGS